MLLPVYTAKPSYPTSVVDRPRLYQRLDRWQEVRAVIVQAPAGFGKDPATLRPELAWVNIYATEHCYWQDQLDCALHHVATAREIASIFQDDQLAGQLPYLENLSTHRSQRSGAIARYSTTLDYLTRIRVSTNPGQLRFLTHSLWHPTGFQLQCRASSSQ